MVPNCALAASSLALRRLGAQSQGWTTLCAAVSGQRRASGGAESRARGLDFRTELTVRGNKFGADMPVDGGGTGELPSPKDLAMAGLASCCSMTLQTTAKALERVGKIEKGALEEIHVVAQDNTKAGTHFPDSVDLIITLKGNLTPAARKLLLKAADRCPVKKMMSGMMPGGVHEKLAE